MSEIPKICANCSLFIPDLGKKAIQSVVDQNHLNAYIAGREGRPLPTDLATFSGSRRCSLKGIVFDNIVCSSVEEFQGREYFPLLTRLRMPQYLIRLHSTEPTYKKNGQKVRKESDSKNIHP